MKILYGVQGTGNGHLTRARVMARELARLNIHTDYLVSGRPVEKLFDMQPFGDFSVATGLTFNYHQGKLDPLATVKNAQPRTLLRDINRLDLSGYDLVITDFEPVSAWAAKRQKVPSIALSHQACFHYQVPTQGYDLASRLIMRCFAPADRHIGLHWHPFGQSILPPIIDTQAHTAGPNEKDLLVYLPFESLADIENLLSGFPAQTFICYHPDVSAPSESAAIHWRPLSREGFARDLARASGVIANSGFELPSESLHLGKKLLVKPLNGQFEQESNARTLRELQLAHVMDSLDPQRLADWLEAPVPQAVNYPCVAAAVSRWLADGADGSLQPLSDQLWQDVLPRLQGVSVCLQPT